MPFFLSAIFSKLVEIKKVQQLTGADIDWLTKYKPISRAGYSIYIHKRGGSELQKGEPDNASAHYNLGLALIRKGLAKDAVKEL